MGWRKTTVLLKADHARWLVRDRTVRGDGPDRELAVVEMIRDGFVVMMYTEAWSGVAEVLSLPAALSFVAAALMTGTTTHRGQRVHSLPD
jgi:hypothetical protein